MSEAISNDYVSMISNTGSGYNIPVIVDAIVDAAIAPMKEIVTGKKEKADAMVSGMALLKATAKISQTNVSSLSASSHHTVSNTIWICEFFSFLSTRRGRIQSFAPSFHLILCNNKHLSEVVLGAHPL